MWLYANSRKKLFPLVKVLNQRRGKYLNIINKKYLNIFRREKYLPSDMSEDFLLRETGAEVSVEWRIERFLSLPDEPDYHLQSPAFSLSDAQWYLTVYPNGKTTDYSFGWISLYLFKRFTTTKKQNVEYTLCIRRKDGSMLESFDSKHEFEKWGGQGCSRFVLASELRHSENIISADGSLSVFATLCLAEPNVPEGGKIVDIPRDATFRVTRPEEVSFEWQMEGFTFLPKDQGFSLKSPTFTHAGAEWCVKMYPNGYDSNYLGWLSLFLSRERSKFEKQTVAFTLGIRKRDGTPYRLSHHEWEFEENIGCGYRKLLKSSELLDSKGELLDQGYVTLFCTVRAIPSPSAAATLEERGTPTSSHPRQEERASQTTPSEHDNHSQPTCRTLHENFRNLLINEQLGDVTIQVQHQKILAHRTILAARSSVFAAMFEHDTEERRTGIVNIDDFDAASFKVFLSFLYSADGEVVSADNSIPLYKVADKYNLQDLKSECLHHLQNRLSLGSFCEVVQLAFMHNEPTLLEKSTEFFVNNAKEIVVTSAWQAMMIEHPALTNELVIKVLTNCDIFYDSYHNC